MPQEIKLFVGRSHLVFSDAYGLTPEEGFQVLESWLRKPAGKDHIVRVKLDPEEFPSILEQYGFRYSRAAGGLILGPGSGLWLIRRWGFWDLPKGKCEPNEPDNVCALREVAEECNIRDATIDRFAGNTYHAFVMQKEKFVKRTAWFLMRSSQDWALPQVEEDIEEVRLVPLSEVSDYFPEMHLTLQYLLKETFPEIQAKSVGPS
ncbi:MAG: NUDIX domain-containing protein [Flavobacteriales bacterium]|nr:NUDIX domain-containing protein [Flavobacteriales bacterium]